MTEQTTELIDPWANIEVDNSPVAPDPTDFDVDTVQQGEKIIAEQQALQETPEEKAAEEATNQGDENPEDEAWKTPDVAVEEIGKSQDEAILERLMANIFDPETATKYTKALFYGEMGTSKTIASCYAGGIPVLLVAVESGAKSLRNHPKIMQHVKVMKVRSVRQVELLAEQLQKGAFPEFEVIVIDTFSELQKMDLDGMVDAGMSEPGKTEWTKWTPEGKMYQGNTEHMRRIAAKFREVDRNVIFTAHVKEDKDEQSRLFLRPDLTDKVQKTLGGYVDLVAYLFKDEDESGKERFFAQCRGSRGPDGRRVTVKTRIGKLPNVIENPSFAFIHKTDVEFTAEENGQ